MRLQPLNRFGRWGVFQQPVNGRHGIRLKLPTLTIEPFLSSIKRPYYTVRK
jgi:hypothetical protein